MCKIKIEHIPTFYYKKMNKASNIAIYVPILAFAIWYIAGSYFNVYSCDDYWHGTNVHTYGFWGAQIYYWTNWEGSYTHTVIATLPHVFKNSYIPFVMNISSLALLMFSFYRFYKTFLVRNIKNSIACAYYTVSIFLLCTSGKEEIRYWVCANSTYLLGISCLLLCLSSYHRQHNNHSAYIMDAFLLCLLAGNKVSFILAMFTLFSIHDIVYGRFLCRKYKLYILLLAIFSLINVSAPGNFIRLEENYLEAVNHPSFFESILNRFCVMEDLLLSWFVLIPIIPRASTSINRKTLFTMIAGLVFVVIGDSAIMYICFRDGGPIRNNVIIELFFYLTVITTLSYLYQRRNFAIPVTFVSLLAISVNLALQTKPFSQLEDTYKYSKLAKLRDQKVECHKTTETIQIDSLPDSGLLLSYFCNDEEWIKYVYLPYFERCNDINLK